VANLTSSQNLEDEEEVAEKDTWPSLSISPCSERCFNSTTPATLATAAGAAAAVTVAVIKEKSEVLLAHMFIVLFDTAVDAVGSSLCSGLV